MQVFDPYLDSLKSTIKPSNVRTHLYDYVLNSVGLGPTTERFGVPNPTTPYIGVGGNYVGMDTSPGNVGRNIDLEKLNEEINNPYKNVNENQQAVKYKGKNYVIGDDQEIVGGKVVAKDRPKGGEGMLASIKDWLDPTQDRDKKGGVSVKSDDGKWKYQVGDPNTGYGMKVADMDEAVKKSQTDKFLEQNQLDQALHQSKQPMYDDMHRRNLELINKVGETQLARDLNYLKQAYPITQAAAWDATNRGIYGDKYSASAAQRRLGESSAAEAMMLSGIASQANAAANMRPRFAGKNISIS